MRDMILGAAAAYAIPLLMLVMAPGAFGDPNTTTRWTSKACRACGWMGVGVVTLGYGMWWLS